MCAVEAEARGGEEGGIGLMYCHPDRGGEVTSICAIRLCVLSESVCAISVCATRMYVISV